MKKKLLLALLPILLLGPSPPAGRAQVAAARLLWPRDPEAGRAAFKAAADGVAELSAGVDAEDQQFYNAAQTVMQLRGELV